MTDTNREPGIRVRLVYSHRYQEALEAYEAELELKPPHLASLLGDRAQMLLCLGRLDEALESYIEANTIRSQQTKGRSEPYLEAIGAVQWMLGGRSDAIRTMRSAVAGILSGKLTYATTANGLGQGLLLWYFGVTERNSEIQMYAMDYLDRPDARSARRLWPGPVAAFVIGELGVNDLFAHASSPSPHTKDDESGTRRKRWRTCHALFYSAVKRRSQGDEAGCLKEMQQCYAVENPIDQEEWYLARHEVERELR